ncbi:hypothetical protein [Xanthomonas sp. 4461]|uniref:hypothetical protein n=1 Tax=Xanthomonas sp. 4461 TaxID=3035313 RepID=UPI00216823B4|nr:hypothetical protein [Xanthomonas sp. 4461]MCS3808141.1 hypothetical protein [Xanthomonas sp. 4461]
MNAAVQLTCPDIFAAHRLASVAAQQPETCSLSLPPHSGGIFYALLQPMAAIRYRRVKQGMDNTNAMDATVCVDGSSVDRSGRTWCSG